MDRLKECQAQGSEGIPTDELLRYMEEAAKGIDFLNSKRHHSGEGPVAIQHCDIKPANIMLTGDAVMICDFGVAAFLSNPSIAATGTSMAGSPAYMSPECTACKPGAASDQYSLALTYVELRTGKLPFRDVTWIGVIDAHRRGNLDLSRLPPREQVVIRKATAVNPDDRYSSAVAMVRALRRAVESPDQEAHQVKPLRLVAMVAAILALLATVGWNAAQFIPWGHRDQPQASASGLDATEAKKTPQVAPQVAEGKVDGRMVEPDAEGRDLSATTSDAQADIMVGKQPLEKRGSRTSMRVSPLDAELKHVREIFDQHNYPLALAELEGLLPIYLDEQDRIHEQRRKLLGALIDSANEQLDDTSNAAPPDDVGREVDKLLQIVIDHWHEGDKPVLGHRALLGRARAAGRIQSSTQWTDVRERLNDLNDLNGKMGCLSGADARIAAVLEVLAEAKPNVRKFFTHSALDELDRLNVSQWAENPKDWEYQELGQLLQSVVQFLEEHPNDAELNRWVEDEDDRLGRIFTGAFQLRLQLIPIRRLLTAESALKPDEYKALGEALKSIANDAKGLPPDSPAFGRLQNQLVFLNCLLGFRDWSIPLEQAANLPTDLAPGSTEADVLTIWLLTRIESEVVKGPLPLNAMDLAHRYITRGYEYTVDRQKIQLRERFSAVKTVHRLWDSNFDFEAARSECASSRSRGVVFPAPIAALLDGMWLECKLAAPRAETGSAPPNREMDDVANKLSASQSQNSGFTRDYVAFVLVRDSVIRVGEDNASKVIATLVAENSSDPILETLTSRPFVQQPARKEFLAFLLLKAAQQLKEKSVLPLVGPAYSQENAGTAARYLTLAVQFGTPPELTRPHQILALFYSNEGKESECLQLLESSRPDPTKTTDGHLLLARATCLNSLEETPNARSDDTIIALADFVKWQASYGNDTDDGKLYEKILAPGLEVAKRRYEPHFENFRDISRPIEMRTKIAEGIRRSLAVLYARVGELIEHNPELWEQICEHEEADAIKNRYLYFRAAAALDHTVAAYFAGQSWATMDFWMNGESQVHLSEMESLADKALAIDADNSLATAVKAVSMHMRARPSNKAMLQKAINLYQKMSDSAEFRSRQRQNVRSDLLSFGSSANVEYANLLKGTPPNQEMVPYLERAISWAREAQQRNVPTQT